MSINIFKRRTILINLVTPIVLAVGFLYAYKNSIRHAGDIGLGRGTSTYTPYINNYPIHIHNMSLADTLKKGWILNGEKNLSLWFGNSQLHGVNQYKEGQKNCIEFCFNKLAVSGRTVLGISYPNANMQELLLSVLFFSHEFPLAKTLIIPAFYDDMREDGIRGEITTNAVRTFLREFGGEKYYANIPAILSLTNDSTSVNKEDGMEALNETFQESTEKYLNDHLQSWSVWASRPDIRGNIFNDLYNTRNTLLGIKSGTVRKMIPGRFRDNYNAFKNIIQYCQDKEIQLLVYIPPLRNDVSPPYDIKEYKDYKTAIERDVIKGKGIFFNLENLVPAEYWGVTATTSLGQSDGIDFMHFQQEGHRLIGDTIFNILVKINR